MICHIITLQADQSDLFLHVATCYEQLCLTELLPNASPEQSKTMLLSSKSLQCYLYVILLK